MKNIFVIFFLSSCAVIYNCEKPRISARKCMEYEKFPRTCIYRYSPLLTHPDREARPKEFPHMALIGSLEYANELNIKIEWFCSGILISDRYVITLAACEQNPYDKSKATHARLGDFNFVTDNDDDDPHDIEIEKIIIHPDYIEKTHSNNIALIRLSELVPFSNYIRPACLPSTEEHPIKEPMILSGWPIRMYHVPLWSKTIANMDLRKYIMETISAKRCNETFAPLKVDQNHLLFEGISERQMCATINYKANDTPKLRPLEQIDGAALQVLHMYHRCLYVVHGLSHTKLSFGLINVPYVFTQIYPYLLWIENIVWQNQ